MKTILMKIKLFDNKKQWTGERFGGAKVTLQTDDFLQLERETDSRRKGYDYVVGATDRVQDYLLKRKTSPDDKEKMMPFQMLGTYLFEYGKVFPEESALGNCTQPTTLHCLLMWPWCVLFRNCADQFRSGRIENCGTSRILSQ